ncbi:hypothetical protein PC5_00020 [Campylobacter phage PC5]|nr:hypothetical protein PC5_00020 [Campylobacter phage PC5]WJZ70191.1 putative Rz IM spanin [Campylobacter phage F341]
MFNFLFSFIKSNIIYILLGSLLAFTAYRYISLEKSNAILIENEKQLTQNIKNSKKELEALKNYNNLTIEVFREKEVKYKEVLNNIKNIETKIQKLKLMRKDENETQYIIVNF